MRGIFEKYLTEQEGPSSTRIISTAVQTPECQSCSKAIYQRVDFQILESGKILIFKFNSVNQMSDD